MSDYILVIIQEMIQIVNNTKNANSDSQQIQSKQKLGQQNIVPKTPESSTGSESIKTIQKLTLRENISQFYRQLSANLMSDTQFEKLSENNQNFILQNCKERGSKEHNKFQEKLLSAQIKNGQNLKKYQNDQSITSKNQQKQISKVVQKDNECWKQIIIRDIKIRPVQIPQFKQVRRDVEIYSSQEVKNYYMSLQLSQQKKQIKIQNIKKDKTPFSFLGCFSKAKKINVQVKFQLIALTKHYVDRDMDLFLLQDIWVFLTQQRFDRYGCHWKKMGFSGQDPAIQLRLSGILCLFLIYLFKQKQSQLIISFYKLSQNEAFKFSFILILTKIVIKYLGLVSQDYVFGNSLQGYLQWFNAICSYVIKMIIKTKIDQKTFDSQIQRILSGLDGRLQKIQNQYKNNSS